MAVARAQGQSGFTAIHVWLIAFVALWLTSTVLLVILYLDQEKNLGQVETMRTETNKIVSSEDKRLPQWPVSKPGSGNTMVSLIEAARADTAALVTGNAADQPAALRQSFDNLVGAIAEDRFIQASGTPFTATTFAGALDDVYRRLRATAEARSEAEKTIAGLTGELDTVRATQTGQKDEFTAQAEALRNEIVKLCADYDKSREDQEKQIADFEQKLAAKEKQCFDDIQQQRSLTGDCHKDYDDLFARFEQLKGKLGQAQVAPLPLGTARRGDGKVLSAKPGEDVVYIDLGQRDHLTLGLEFAVYDALTGVPEDGRAKARIEVVSVQEQTATCRIAQLLTTEMIRRDDIIANPVYDRFRTLKFFVVGEFDLDANGRAEPDGRLRIEAIVKNWGGLVQERLDAQVDFVVLGGSPPAPRRSMQFTEAEDTQYQSEKKTYDTFVETFSRVRALGVPVLPQSVFMNFLGRTRTPIIATADVRSPY